ncbi:MAG: hypothetical protein JW732_00065 [Dehalococcoidia bacterium]|nr:hypothetical protein [Dehalococcoidia bacterium]
MHSKKFFIPHAETPEASERIYQVIKAHAQTSTVHPITKRRIFRIEYTHNGIKHEAEVGAISTANGEEVMAILESFVYLVCTPSRGAAKNTIPIYVGIHDTTLVEDFEA